MQLISEASQWHRLWSIRFAIMSAIFGAIPTAYMALPPDWLPVIPGWVKLLLAAGSVSTAAASSVARVVKQANVGSDDTDQAGA